jgi:asparagine synthase (glutamine-hydrolysing)
VNNVPRAAYQGWVDVAQLDGGLAVPESAAGQRSGPTEWRARGVEISIRNGARLLAVDGGVALIAGTPRVAGTGEPASDDRIREAVLRFGDGGEPFSGRYAVVHVDARQRVVHLVADRFGVHPLCYTIEGTRLTFAERADAMSAAGQGQLDPQALFNYLYFHVLPAPRTVFAGVSRLEAAHRLRFNGTRMQLLPTWKPLFKSAGASHHRPSVNEFRELLRSAVERELGASATGAFLSGGTDSSTVAGMLRAVTNAAPSVFSIGFEAEGYDEIEYAKIAARHFGCAHFVYYVTPDDVANAVPDIAAHYDQPFGNSSALPAYYCARLARSHGVTRLLAGDGGDELFGGNVRYAKQKVFAVYDAIPPGLRRTVLEPLALSRPLCTLPVLRKLASYVEQARVPMPERTETYNLLLRHGIANLLSPRFVQAVRADEPAQLQRRVYAESEGAALVDRMLAYDWRFTLADNDLPKVIATASLAQLEVGFPFLDDRLVDFSLRLSASQKVRALKLRHWFKKALADFLPIEILRKKKHGFGLPFGPWLIRHPALQRLARDSIDGLVERGLVAQTARDRLFSPQLEAFPGYYGEMIWILMMAEQWMRRGAPRWQLR